MNRAEASTKIRDYLRDKKELNKLLDNEFESSQRQIEFAMDMAIDDYNNTPPRLGTYTVDNFPWSYLLIIGSVVQVLKSAGLEKARNNLQYSDGGLSIDVESQAPAYGNWLQILGQEYEDKKMRAKQSENLEACWSI